MTRSLGIIGALLSLALAASPVAAQSKPDLTVALSSFSTEVLDPVLGGHVVKYYMSLMFDYLVGVTPDGQLSKDTGLPLDEIKLESMLVEDLGLDSLEDIEAIMAIEEQTGITFTDEDAAGFRSLRDIIEYLRRRQDE